MKHVTPFGGALKVSKAFVDDRGGMGAPSKAISVGRLAGEPESLP